MLNFRRIVETGAVPLITHHATDQCLSQMVDANRLMQQALTTSEAAEWDYRFHLALAQGILPDVTCQAVAVAGPEAFDTVFDATGNINAMNAGLSLVAHGGSYVLLSVVKGDLSFPDPEFHKREATLIGSRNALEEDFRHVMDCMAKGLVPVGAIATHRTTLDGAATDLPKWAADRGTVMKALIHV